jgi:succinoglycan biosynthesis transport protein ExoP
MPSRIALQKPYLGLSDPAEFLCPLVLCTKIVRQHLAKIGLFSILPTILVVLGCALAQPIYDATAVIAIDWQGAPETMRLRELLGAEKEEFMGTQETLLQAETILRPIEERYKLLERERQLRHYRFWHYSSIKERAIRSGPLKLKHLKIEHAPKTYLLTITYCDSDPQIAADVANAIADTYLRNISEARIKEVGGLNSSIEQELNELNQHLESIELDLVARQRVPGNADPEEITTLPLAQSQPPKMRIKAAEADRVPVEAVYPKAGYSKLPEARMPDRWRNLIENTKLPLVKANNVLVDGPHNESEGHLKAAQVGKSDASPNASHPNVSARRSLEYRQTLDSERTISSAAGETRQQVDDLSSHPFDYQQLKHEVDAAERVYQNISARIKQVGIRSDLHNFIRLANSARPSATPSFPNWPWIVGLSMAFFALSSGVYVVWGVSLASSQT